MQNEFQEMDRKVNELRAVMLPDALGNGGIISRIKRLERKEDQEEKTLEFRLKFWVPILIAIISTSGLIFREWPDIRDRWNHNIEELTAPKQPVKKIRHRRHVVVPSQEEEDGSSTMQE